MSATAELLVFLVVIVIKNRLQTNILSRTVCIALLLFDPFLSLFSAFDWMNSKTLADGRILVNLNRLGLTHE